MIYYNWKFYLECNKLEPSILLKMENAVFVQCPMTYTSSQFYMM